jgi:hypothetical protein
MIIIFFDIKGIVKESIPRTTVAFYGDCVKMCGDFARNFATKELAVASRQRTVSRYVFRQGIVDQKQHECLPPPTLIFSASPVED